MRCVICMVQNTVGYLLTVPFSKAFPLNDRSSFKKRLDKESSYLFIVTFHINDEEFKNLKKLIYNS